MPGGGAASGDALQGPKSTIDRLVRSAGERDLLELSVALGASRRRLLGWEPEERHEHYDAEGNLTGYTVVTREPEFDDDELGVQLAHLQYQRGIHSGLGQCGIHESLTDDDDIYWTFDSRTCPTCAFLAQNQRIQAAEDKRIEDAMGEDVPPERPRPSDGRRSFLRQMTPEEVAERMEASPRPERR